MKTKHAKISIPLLVSLLAMFALGVGSALAEDPVPGTPISGDGVVPLEYDGNVSCLYLGYPFGFKIEGNGATVYTGTFPFDLSKGGLHTGSAPNDPYNSVTTSSDGYYLNWTATLGIDAVIVKGGQDSNAYVYFPEDTADTGLASPTNDKGGGLPEISHVEFCYDYELTATKTANAQFKRTYSWKITKDYDKIYTGFIGDPAFDHNYLVTVDQSWVDSDFAVSGNIVVNNPSPLTVNFSVSDSVGGTAAAVSCPSYTLAPWGSVTCTYSAALLSKTDGTNTATISTSTYGAVGTTATKAYTFGDPTSEDGYKTINVTDDFYGALGSASADEIFNYSKKFQCEADPSMYVNGVWTMTEFVNTATITETGQSDVAKVNLTCYAPLVSKDAFTKYTKEYTWDITKDYDGTYKGFIGDAAFDHDYVVEVDQTITPKDFTVYGTITVQNPNPDKAMTVSLADSVGGTAATLDCGGSLIVPKGGSATCGYSAVIGTMTDGTNTATATLNSIGFDATANYSFDNAIVSTEGFTEIKVTDDKFGPLGSASGDATFNYSKEFQCSANKGDYKNGVWTMEDFVNTASIVEITSEYDSATVKLTCYAPVLDKDAFTNWEEKYTWDITKDYDGTYEGFIGDALFNHGYEVTVDQTVTPQNFKVYGSIYVTNPAGSPGDMTVGLVDYLDALTAATVNCGSGATSVTVAPGATGTCSYSGYLLAKTDGTNTATGTFNGVNFVTTKDYTFGAATPVGFTTINVTDDKYGDLGSASDDKTFTYSGEFQCSANQADYKNGVWTMKDFVNTASIKEIPTEYDSATVKLTCYAPVITKTASASYDERHIWDVEKTVDPESQGGFPGSILPWTWNVVVSEDFIEENFLVTGKIYVTNPAPTPIEVILTDALDDGTVAKIDYCETPAAEFVLINNKLPVPANTTATCYYTAIPAGRTATENRATGKFNSIDFFATADVNFVKTVVNGTATVTDTEIGLNEELTAGAGPWTYTKDYSHTCSSNRADYFVDGEYKQGKWEITNWAYVKTGEVLHDKDDATTTYTCDASFVDILKTTNGVIDPTKDIRFKLYDSAGNDLNDEVSTLNDEDGQLQFKTALVPGATYTVCESPVPAGYTFEITVDGGNVLTYAGPPGTVNPTGEVQCFDFTAPEKSTTVVFAVNNRYPGGAPRTPGYWKNWNACTGGNQAETAAKLGGVEANVFILEDLLPQTLGNYLTISSCQAGVYILDNRDLSGKNMASDAAYILARSLLAARLNQDAGACVPPATFTYLGQTNMSLEQILTAADNLLTGIKFNGTGDYLGPKVKGGLLLLTTRNNALYLYGIIDAYNNGKYCTGTPSH